MLDQGKDARPDSSTTCADRPALGLHGRRRPDAGTAGRGSDTALQLVVASAKASTAEPA
ncbi:hypothetical protein ACRAWD_03855 [Caulobacter segnis]